VNDARELIDAIRGLNAALRSGFTTTVNYGTRASSSYFGFNGTITGTNSLTVWTPLMGNRYRAKAVAVTAIVSTQLAASNPVTFFFADGTTGEVVAPIGAATATAAVGTLIPPGTSSTGPLKISLDEGCPGSAAEATLVIKTSETIGAGVVRFTGIAWGEEFKA